MDLMVSVRFNSNDKNNFPLRVNARTLFSIATNNLSAVIPGFVLTEPII